MDKSFVLIKTAKCGSTTINNKLRDSNFCDRDEILNAAYDELFDITERHENKFRLSINHINRNFEYEKALDDVMVGDIQWITCLRDPLERAISHYYYANAYRDTYSFNEFYTLFGNNDAAGWTGREDRTNNYMSNYIGFDTDRWDLGNFSDTKERVSDFLNNNYSYILLVEYFDKAFKRLSEMMELDEHMVPEVINKTKNKPKIDVWPEVRSKFILNNLLDYIIYTEAFNIYEYN